MKTVVGLCGTTALLFALAGLNAQTNSVVPAANTAAAMLGGSNAVDAASATSTNAMRETEIFADRLDIESKTRTAVYSGNVRLIDPRMNLTCDTLTAQMGESTNRFRHVMAEGNVVIDSVDDQGNPVHATSGKADYDYRVANSLTNEFVELSVNPRVERVERGATHTNHITGKIIVWD